MLYLKCPNGILVTWIRYYNPQCSSVIPFICFRCFLGIGSLSFSKFWHGVRNLCEVVPDRAGLYWKKRFCLKNAENDQKKGPNRGFFEFI